jgi:hypothetical protein
MINELIDGINMDTLDKESFKKLFENKKVVDGSLVGNIKGFAIFDKIVVDKGKFYLLPDTVQVFFLLHELCHSLRYDKLGVEYHFKTLTNENFDEFADSVVNEELIADRYASIMFYKLTGLTYNRYLTQRLTEPYYRNMYVKHVVPLLFKKFKNRKSYEKFWGKFIKKDDKD